MTEVNSITATNSASNAVGIARYDLTAPSDNVGTMSFGDFLDMVNPLQHIPVASSIYRAVTGETINPVSRIAGDALFGGIMGLASAGIAALGAAADEGFAAANGGKDVSQTIVAALSGDDSDSSVQTASSATPDATTTTTAAPVLESVSPDTQTQAVQVALLQTPARQSPILDMPDFSATSTTAQTSAAPATTASVSATTLADASTSTSAPTGIAIDRSKQAYGGVMDSTMMQNAMQNQTLALALAGGQQALQSQHSLRNSRFSTTGASPVTATTAQSAALPLPGNTPMLSGGPTSAANQTPSVSALTNATPVPANTNTADATAASATSALPAALRSIPQTGNSNLKTIKGLDNYRITAQRVPIPYVGTTVNVTN
jgi:hypothetical protein